jgi:hypothetical protein
MFFLYHSNKKSPRMTGGRLINQKNQTPIRQEAGYDDGKALARCFSWAGVYHMEFVCVNGLVTDVRT